MRGYAYEFVKQVRAQAKSPQANEAVRLGMLAIEYGVAIKDIARDIGVSRMTVYDWFTGKYVPKADNLHKLKEYIASKQP